MCFPSAKLILCARDPGFDRIKRWPVVEPKANIKVYRIGYSNYYSNVIIPDQVYYFHILYICT